MVIQEKIDLEPGEFIEFAEDGIFFCIKNDGFGSKRIKIQITNIKGKK